jgi:hypothetical protein
MVADSVTFKAKFGRGGTRKRKRAEKVRCVWLNFEIPKGQP